MKPRHQQSWFLLEAQREDLVRASLLSSGGGWPPSLVLRGRGCITLVSASLFTWPSALFVCVSKCIPLLIIMPVLGFKARPIQHDLILTGLHLVNTLFRGSHSQVVGVRALTDLYGRHKSTHTTQDHIHFFPFFFFFQ